MTEPQTTQTSQTSESADTPTPGSSGDQLGNILIGAALVMGFILLLGFRWATTNGDDDEPRHRDAEVEFVRDRDRDDEVEFARTTYVPDETECEYEDDGDLESQFADDAWCEPTGGGLFPDDAPRDRDGDDLIDFDRYERPTLRADLADRGSSRLREVEISLGPGRSDVDIAVRNDEEVDQYGYGIAVRTENDARLLSSTRFVTIERPNDCRNGCDFRIWLTMGASFQDRHPDAEIMIYAGDDADAWIDEIDSLPNRVYR